MSINLQEQLAAQSAAKQSLMLEIKALSQQAQQDRAQIAELKAHSASLEKRLAQSIELSQHDRIQKDRQIESLKDQLKQKQKELQSLAQTKSKDDFSEMQSLRKTADQYMQKCRQLEQQIRNFQSKKPLEQQLTNLEEQNKFLKNKVQSMKILIQTLRKQQQRTKKVAKPVAPEKDLLIDHEVAVLKDMVNSLKTTVRTKEGEIVRLRKKLNGDEEKKGSVHLPPLQKKRHTAS